MEHADLESIADALHARAGSEPDDPATPIALARLILGRENLRTVDSRWLKQDGVLCRVHGNWQIWVRRNLPAPRLAFVVAHELLELELLKAGYTGEDAEQAANYGAAAVLAPRRAFQRALRSIGENLEELAEAFVTTETMAGLRLGEVTGQPIVLLSRSHYWIRGAEWVWPNEPTLRRIATRTTLPTGLRRTRLKDDPRRVMLLADELTDT